MDKIRLNALAQAVEQHLAEHGGRNWKLLQGRFPDVSHATFWRTVKTVRKGGAKSAVRASDNTNDLTCIFPLAYEPMKVLAEIQAQLQHADDLIAQSKGLNGKIKNWKMNARGISLRQTALARKFEATKELYNLKQIELFYERIIDAIADEGPAVRDRVILRLTDKNKASQMHAPALLETPAQQIPQVSTSGSVPVAQTADKTDAAAAQAPA